MMPRESGRLRRRLAIVTALLVGSASGASLTSLSARDADKMKSVLYGGACWVVACTDADDKGTGQSLLERAMDDADAAKACSGATLKCDAKLPSGKSTRRGIAGRPRRRRGPAGLQAGRGEARATWRTLSAVVADAKTLGSFSLAKALPGGAATALYLRRLNANEKAALAAAAAKLPAAKRDDAAFDASACGAGDVLAKSADDADRNFEAKRLAPRDWAGAGDAAETLVFRSSGVYLSYGARAGHEHAAPRRRRDP
ncbi:hypothetical protein JL720_12592 [Aureococcus anophagefferens]|nr:hypothetical protein JL720_12592 [Aureococcus anophagefferens]